MGKHLVYERPQVESRVAVRGLLGDDLINCLLEADTIDEAFECLEGGLGSEGVPL